jgi:hypothetical protein
MKTDITTLPFFPQLEKFVAGVNEKIAAYWKQNNFTFDTPPVVMVENVGSRYIRLAKFKHRPHFTGPLVAESVYCFVDISTGLLHKGSWRAIERNSVRGDLADPNVLDKFDHHGPKYLR